MAAAVHFVAAAFKVALALRAMPTVVELSFWIGYLSWGHAISIRVWKNGIMFLAVMKSPASLDSAAEDMTNLMIWASVITGPLSQGIGLSSDRKMKESDWLCALDSLR